MSQPDCQPDCPQATRELTGRHVLAIVVTAFTVIIGANLTMLFAATGSFPGLVVGNSYVAGVGWDARAAAQQDLGWSLRIEHRDNALRIALTDAEGQPVTGVSPAIRIGRPTTDAEDRAVTAHAADAGFVAPVQLAPGRWQVEFRVAEPAFAATAEVFVREDD